MGNVYNREFQEMLIDHADKSADRIIPFVYDLFTPNSVVDFGCGTGNFLATVKNIQIINVKFWVWMAIILKRICFR